MAPNKTKFKRSKQQTLEESLGQPKVNRVVQPLRRATVKTPRPTQSTLPRQPRGGIPVSQSLQGSVSSFMKGSRPKRAPVEDSSSDSAAEGAFHDSEEENEPLQVTDGGIDEPGRPGIFSSGPNMNSASQEPSNPDEDDSDVALIPTSSARRRNLQKRKAVRVESDDDSDDIIGPSKRRRLVRRPASDPALSDHEESVLSTLRPEQGAEESSGLYTPMKRGRRLAPSTRSAKKRHLELLRRRRAGEVIEEEDLSSSEDDGVRGIYDSDPDLPALDEFEDDEEGVLQVETPRAVPLKKSKKREEKGTVTSRDQKETSQDQGDEAESEDLDDFIVEDDDVPLGVPAELLDIPIEFTSHAHKPLKEQFRHVVEWLVQTKINPGFSERKHALYMMAWRKLDDEVRGLAESKFSSSAWKSDFSMALRARPGIETGQLGAAEVNNLQSCMACGRRNHPARWVVHFTGSPYYKNASSDHFLEDVDGDSDTDSARSSDSGNSSARSVGNIDEDGNRIASENRRWFVGVVCSSNAETAHSLIHWKHHLQDWVTMSLEAQKYMEPKKLKEREQMKAKKRYRLVDQIVEKWATDGTLKSLYGEFKRALEAARNKSTTGRVSHRRF
ncbi:hypothetical protein VTK73DRAFT_4159 [Phialemonium thermophilum]|uniref:DUF4211 domain-containing protein n=1 Tax=Phialemonium thermophilum TaxID=223376 RepID=A0ABR3Y083_9PEZI